jgi:glycosyltransferase involved in cell wall biosynthesis
MPYDSIFMHHFLKRVEKIICVSESELQQYSQILKLPKNKFALIPNGANFSFSDTGTPGKNFRYILSVGRLEKSKGFQYLLKSFSLISREKEFEDVKLVIVGNGPYKNNLIKLITELKINQKVRMLENVSQDDLKILYQDCVAFILLSEYESQSIVIVDALAMHKPVICTRQGALGEYVRKGYSIGVDWPPDPAIVAFEMANLLRNPKKRVPINFTAYSWDDVTLQLISLYKSVLSEKTLN